MPDCCGFDVFGDFQWQDFVFCLFEYSTGSWVPADNGVEVCYIFDDIVLPIFIAVKIRQCIDGKFDIQCFQYFGDHCFSFFVSEWIFYRMLFVGRSYAYDKFRYSLFPCLIQRIYMSVMKWLETTDEQSCFLFHRKILGINLVESISII